MGTFDHIKTCFDLTSEDVVLGVESRSAAFELLSRMSKVSAPNSAVAKILLVFARMATTACDWLDGDLRIEMRGDGDACHVDVLTELGAGYQERVWQTITLKVSFEELSRAVERVPHMIQPLSIKAQNAQRMVLGATEDMRRSSLPPPPIKISDESLLLMSSALSRQRTPDIDNEQSLPVIPGAQEMPLMPGVIVPGAVRAKPGVIPPANPNALRRITEKPPSIQRTRVDPRAEPDEVDKGWEDS